MGIGHRATGLIEIVGFFVTIAWIAIALRLYVRAFIVRSFGPDDRWMLFAQLMHTLNAACAIGGALTGTGRLTKDLEPRDIMKALRFWWICYFSYCLCMIGAKISVGLSLLRYTPVTRKAFRCFIHVAISTSVVMGLAFALLAIFQCKPVHFFWTRALGDDKGTCINMDTIVVFTYIMSAIFALCDFSFAILPVFLIKGLDLSRCQKIALVPILSMACIASSAVLVRLAYVPSFRDPDFLYATVPIAICSEVEMSLAITAGSLSTLRPLCRIAVRNLGWKTSFSSARRSGHLSKEESTIRTAGSPTQDADQISCAESDRELVSENQRSLKGHERVSNTKATQIQIEYEDISKV